MNLLPRHADDDHRDEQALRVYTDQPLDDGDAVLLLDGTVCLELQRVADACDDLGRRDLVATASRCRVSPGPHAAGAKSSGMSLK